MRKAAPEWERAKVSDNKTEWWAVAAKVKADTYAVSLTVHF